MLGAGASRCVAARRVPSRCVALRRGAAPAALTHAPGARCEHARVREPLRLGDGVVGTAVGLGRT
eukprot:scaffold1318_cov388-Prasinococcus_capsulatus_cf.AAC.79